ncbi:MAG: enoyl-CoA hydratase/isomerase family protein [Kineosporiaceae bacterium]|nr:enoyl-CoA hydratase/isomerase family protein [Kineosporiaceae bacterium]
MTSSTQSPTRPSGSSTPLPELPDEVVTRALLREVALPRTAGGDPGTIALITLDNGRDHTRPTTLGPAGLASLDSALDGAAELVAAGRVRAVAITGKPFFFLAGADLTMAASGATVATSAEHAREIAVAIGRRGHDVLRRLGELGVPSFAFVNGVALGGGVEVALHCTYRTISSGVPALALPECFLGILPGWGGTYLLPRLIGVERALEVIIANPMQNNRMLNGRKAFDLGIADAMFEPADFLERSLVWAAEVLTGVRSVERAEVSDDEASWAAAVAEARAGAELKFHGAAPAYPRALDLVALARTADRDTAFEAESQSLADLIVSPQFANSLYAFDLVNKRAKRPVGVPSASLARPVTKVGVVGAGLMATQLATLFLRRLKVPVALTDLDADRVTRGVEAVRSEIRSQAAKGRIRGDEANRLEALVSGSVEAAEAFAGADLVIEAVFEELEVKKQVLAAVERVVSPECVLMTNTSSLSVSAMAAELEHPERVVGFHFFNPVAVLPLVEVVRAERTDDATLATAFAVGKGLRKSCVLVADAPAFVVNRLLTRFLGEVTAAVDEGTPVEVADAALEPLGLPMSPFTLLQLVGPAVALHVAETMHAAYPDRFGVSQTLRSLVAAGRTGVFTWGMDGKPYVDEETRALFVQGEAPSSAEQVRERALSALGQECALMLSEGVVAEAADIDLCMLLGAGWPFHLGGITPYLRRSGHLPRTG